MQFAVSTPMKNMGSSFGMIIPSIRKVIKGMFQSQPVMYNQTNDRNWMKKWFSLAGIIQLGFVPHPTSKFPMAIPHQGW